VGTRVHSIKLGSLLDVIGENGSFTSALLVLSSLDISFCKISLIFLAELSSSMASFSCISYSLYCLQSDLSLLPEFFDEIREKLNCSLPPLKREFQGQL